MRYYIETVGSDSLEFPYQSSVMKKRRECITVNAVKRPEVNNK